MPCGGGRSPCVKNKVTDFRAKLPRTVTLLLTHTAGIHTALAVCEQRTQFGALMCELFHCAASRSLQRVSVGPGAKVRLVCCLKLARVC